MKTNNYFLILLLIIILIPSILLAQEPEFIGTIRIGNANTLFGHRILPLGDQNGDGYDDILVYELRSSPEPMYFNSYFFYGGDTTNSNPFLILDDTRSFNNNIGDINNDGFDDLLIGGGWNENFKIGLYYGGPLLDTIRDMWFGSDTLYAVGYSVLGNDINSNGTDEIISRDINNQAVLLFEIGSAYDTMPDLKITPPNLGYADYANMGNGIISGDFNGDRKRDLALNVGPRHSDSTNGSIYLYWGSPSFDTIPDMIITRPDEYAAHQYLFGELLACLGDFNGDGYDDFYAGTRPSEDTVGMIFFGGPDIDDIPDILISGKSQNVKLAGDINNDGYNDMITSYPLPFSGSGKVSIYYVGPSADSIADIVYHNWQDPRYQTEFGNDCAGIGDFNGDGVDDFAYSFQTSSGVGEVYVYAGINAGTDVEYNYQDILPQQFDLRQNYPNPFNPSTIIEFELKKRSSVVLTVFNILGERITTLVNDELGAGSYVIKWDGCDSDGMNMPTGIYFYRLQADDFIETKKMVLVK